MQNQTWGKDTNPKGLYSTYDSNSITFLILRWYHWANLDNEYKEFFGIIFGLGFVFETEFHSVTSNPSVSSSQNLRFQSSSCTVGLTSVLSAVASVKSYFQKTCLIKYSRQSCSQTIIFVLPNFFLFSFLKLLVICYC